MITADTIADGLAGRLSIALGKLSGVAESTSLFLPVGRLSIALGRLSIALGKGSRLADSWNLGRTVGRTSRKRKRRKRGCI